jgi:uncharacterized protein (TIGR02646 family)
MIKRTRAKRPPVLVKKAALWKKNLLSAASPKQKSLAVEKYRHAEIRETLREMFDGKCAYCESHISHTSYPHIEHFRPKSGPVGRPSLTFTWSNLLLACGICNGPEFKGDRFPGPASGGPLINPLADDPDQHFDFVFDPITKLATVVAKTRRGATTVQFIGSQPSGPEGASLEDHHPDGIYRVESSLGSASSPVASREPRKRGRVLRFL